MKLSVTLITKNEELNISACLESVRFADEVIVVDSGSADRTVEIAKALGAKVIVTTDWPGFGVQKGRALAQAQGEWILSLDADERVSPKLQREILKVISSSSDKSAFKLPRLTNFCGDWIYHSGWYPDYHTRLFRRDSAHFSDDLVHECVVVDRGVLGHLNAPLIHYSFRTQNDFLRKMVQYSLLGAEQSKLKGRSSSVSKAVAFATIDFLRMFVWRRGFLDGRAGLVIALLSAEAMFHKYLGLHLLLRPSANVVGDPPPPARWTE